MNRWTPAIVTVAGLGAAALAFLLFGLSYGATVLIATLWYAASGRPVIGTTPIRTGTTVAAREVRRYREEHPASTITEAIAMVDRGQTIGERQ